MPKGLATQIHATSLGLKDLSQIAVLHPIEQTQYEVDSFKKFYIKGPMGKGLQLQPSGTHVAFCAGTGALVFLDLVAQLLILNCFKHDGKGLPDEMANFFQPGFKLHLYAAFASREQAIGLELIEALQFVN